MVQGAATVLVDGLFERTFVAYNDEVPRAAASPLPRFVGQI